MGSEWSSPLGATASTVSAAVTAVGTAVGTAAAGTVQSLYRSARGGPGVQVYDPEQVVASIGKLQATLDKLSDKLDHMTRHATEYAEEARQLYRAGHRARATHQLRLQKMYAAEARKLECLKFNIESNILHMESVGVIMETVATIKDTSEHFQLVHRQIDVDQLEDTVEQMMEQRDTSKDLQTLLNDASPASYDDDDLLRELQAMEDEGQPAPPPPSLPAPPSHAVRDAAPAPPPAAAAEAAAPPVHA